MWLQGLWDQEDMWGAIHCYAAVEPKDTSNDKNFLVMGPWRHSQVNHDGSSLGPLQWDGDTTLQFRRDVLLPFFNQYLLDGAPKADTPPVLIYNTGENHWDRFKSWPLSCDASCPNKSKPLYLTANGAFRSTRPTHRRRSTTNTSPTPPSPCRIARARFSTATGRLAHLAGDDQRFVDGRPDVLTYVSEPLTEPLRVSGAPK